MSSMQPPPFFSIIVPTYQRPQQLAVCLEALTHLQYPRDRFEVVVVDDGSSTPLDSVVASFAPNLMVTLLRQANTGPAGARNAGAAQAKGQFFAFTDDDCTPASDWLTVLAHRFDASPDVAIGGQTRNRLTDNPYATASQLLITYLYTYYNANPHNARFFTSNNLAFPAEGFHAIGGFNTSYTRTAAEDREICDRWLSEGREMQYVPEAVIYHAHALTLRTFWRQHFIYGRGAWQFRQARAHRSKGPVKVEPLSFYGNLLWFPFVHQYGVQAPLLTALLFSAQVAHVVGFFRERRHSVKR